MRSAASWHGPIVLHVLTQKGKGYAPAEADEVQKLHDYRVAAAAPYTGPADIHITGSVPRVGAPTDDPGGLAPPAPVGESYTDAFSKSLLEAAEADDRIVAITAAMPGPTGLLSFEEHFPARFFDVGIAEQHAMTAAAGMAMQGLRPVAAIYSTFVSRCFDQWNLDVGLHRLPVVVVADRAGITGDDGPSHHGLYDMVQALQIPGAAVFAPSEPAEVGPALASALEWGGPALVRYPKTASPGPLAAPGEGMRARRLREGSTSLILVGIGKLARACVTAASLLDADGLDVTVYDPRVIRPADAAMLDALAAADLVVTAEDGLAHGGAGSYLCAEASAVAALQDRRGPTTVVLGVPTTYVPHAKPDAILSKLGLDAEGIAESVRSAARRQALLPG
jgi:1-deoxy-D-xylulose-5-phosphate synthase